MSQKEAPRGVRISPAILTMARDWETVQGLATHVPPSVAAECDAAVRAAVDRGGKSVDEAIADIRR